MPRLDDGTYAIPADPDDPNGRWVQVSVYSSTKGRWVRQWAWVK